MLLDPAFRPSPGVLYPAATALVAAFAWCVASGAPDVAVLLASCVGTTLAARAALAADGAARGLAAAGGVLVATLSLASAVTGEPGAAPGVWGLLPLALATAASRGAAGPAALAACALATFAAEASGLPMAQSMAGGLAGAGATAALATATRRRGVT